jgi:hypothetical protein
LVPNPPTEHERKLADDRDEREAAGRRGARAYTERRDVHRNAINWALTEVNHVSFP